MHIFHLFIVICFNLFGLGLNTEKKPAYFTKFQDRPNKIDFCWTYLLLWVFFSQNNIHKIHGYSELYVYGNTFDGVGALSTISDSLIFWFIECLYEQNRKKM